ncbi:NACHT domain-containing protein [Streptomyces sp. NPDC057694]|uniref:NACHT domain-containing protein n=1 Tax=Streptomyces sp. NPDC057694 TaxID=3346216 RepID=UPI00367EB7F1
MSDVAPIDGGAPEPGPADKDDAPAGAHVNKVSDGAVVYGPVFQGRDFTGGVTVHFSLPPTAGQEQLTAREPGLRAEPDPQDELRRAAERLAKAVEVRWGNETRRRKVGQPKARLLPVRWTTADTLMDHWTHICGDTEGRAGPLDLSEASGDIARTYRKVPSGRLVVLGEVGSGKTVLGLRLVLELLKDRRPGEPVPEFFSLGAWNPKEEKLAEWLSSRLTRDTTGMDAATADGKPVAAALVDEAMILPVLDGFDEIAERLRHDALKELNSYEGPLVLTSRTGPYAGATADTRGIQRAAAIELNALTPDDTESFLVLGSAPSAESEWNQVLAKLRDRPDTTAHSSLREVLSTPLMVSLVRDIYGERADTGNGAGRPDQRPEDLLKFASRDKLEEHLLSSFVPSAYDRRPSDPNSPPRHWSPRRARRWLGYLADHLNSIKSPDLEWWRLGTEMSLRARTAVVSFLAGMPFALATGIGNIPVNLIATSHGLGFAILRGVVVGLLHGLVSGPAFGYAYWRANSVQRSRPSPVQVRLTGRDRGERGGQFFHGLFHKALLAARIGFVVALLIVLVDRLLLPLLALGDGLGGGFVAAAQFPLTIGLSAGTALALMTWLETPIDLKESVGCVDLLRQNRENALAQLVVWALALGLISGVAASFVETPLRSFQIGLVFGLEGAFGGGFGYCLCLTAYGQWFALVRVWLPLTGRMPWRPVAFLEDACSRDVLRRAGAVYQFRHARLQAHLATPLSQAPSSGAKGRQDQPSPDGDATDGDATDVAAPCS